MSEPELAALERLVQAVTVVREAKEAEEEKK
jgi:hypothetical protein